MKKRISGYQLNRDTNARKALLKGLVSALIMHENIETTKAKGKAVQSVFEKMTTRAKRGQSSDSRWIQGYIQDRSLVKKLVSDIAPRYKEIKSGYTKIVVVGNRRGDNATLVRLMLTKKTELVKKGVAKVDEQKAEKTKAVKPELQKIVAPKNARPTKVASSTETKGMIGARRGER